MKSLSDIIQEKLNRTKSSLMLEKLKVNSKTRVYKDTSDWCIAAPYDDLFDIFNKEFKDYKFEFRLSISPFTNDYIFVMQPKQLEKYIDNPKLFLFKIPDKFKNMGEFIDALRRKEIKVDDLEDWTPEK